MTNEASKSALSVIQQGDRRSVALAPLKNDHQAAVLVWLPKGEEEAGKRLWRTALYLTGYSATRLTLELSSDTDLWLLIGLPDGVATPRETIKEFIHRFLDDHMRDGAPITLKGGPKKG